LEFELDSDAAASCYNQIKIDFFDEYELGNTKVSSGSCEFTKTYNCFDSSESTQDFLISGTPYCQKINLPASPGFKLGAWVKRTDGLRNLRMKLFNEFGDEIENANCELPEASTGSEISCEVDYFLSDPKEHYVCIYSASGGGTYHIRGYDTSDSCGFWGSPAQTPSSAYQIFAEGKKFDSPSNLKIQNQLPEGDTLNVFISDYLIDKYGAGTDCSEGCIIPLILKSEKSQSISLKNLNLIYSKTSGSVTENNFYEIEEIPAKITSESQKLSLDNANLTLSGDYGESTYKLEFNDEELFSEKITIEKVPTIKNIYPLTTAAAYPTKFIAEIETPSGKNITEYQWEFENKKTEKTFSNKITHTFNETGTYELKLTITDSEEKSSYKIFSITVESPEERIETFLKEKQDYLSNITKKINSYPTFHKAQINKILNLEEAEDELESVQRNQKSAKDKEDFIEVMEQLVAIEIPSSIQVSKKADSVPFYPERKNIDIDVLAAISKDDYESDDEKKYVDAVYAWNQEHVETKLNFKEYSAIYNQEQESILKIFEITVNELKESPGNPNIILENLEDLDFEENYLESEETKYIYIDLERNNKITFSTTEEVDFVTLPLFISPELSRLELSESTPNLPEPKNFPIEIFVLVIILLIIIFIVVYIVLQQWYKKKYEKHLFDNQNQLLNLARYIQNSKKKNLPNSEIRKRLKKAGWRSEKIDYAMKKYAGQRTGMMEIPISKLMNLFKKKQKQPKNNFNPRFKRRL